MFYNRVRYKFWYGEIGGFEVEEPTNWKEDNKKFSRHLTYHGISTTLSSALKFIGDAREFLISVYTDYGVNADVRLTRELKDKETDIWELDYEGWVDFMTFKQTEEEIEVKFTADPLTNRLKAKQGDKVELEREDDLDGNLISALELRDITLPGRMILQANKLSHNREEIPRLRQAQSTRLNPQVWPMELQEIDTPEFVENPTVFGQYPEDVRDADTEQYGSGTTALLRNQGAEALTFKINLSHKQSCHWQVYSGLFGDPPNNTTISLRLAIYILNGTGDKFLATPERIEKVFYSYDIVQGGVFPNTININEREFEVSLAPGEAGCFEWHVTGGYNLTSLEYGYRGRIYGQPEATKVSDYAYVDENGNWSPSFYETSITISQDTLLEPTTSKCIRIHEFARRLAEISLSSSFYSSTLGTTDVAPYVENGPLSDLVLLNGMWARGMESGVTNYKPISSSLKDFLESLDAISPIGIELKNDTLKLEDREYFYIKEVTVTVNNVSELEITPAEKEHFSKIKVGYQKSGGYEEEQGLDEYNRETEYSTILNKTENELNLISKYRADSYGLETVRREHPDIAIDYNGDDDSRFDDQIWFLDANETTGILTVSDWTKRFAQAPSSVYSPETAYNLWLSPINILLRHGKFIKPAVLKYLSTYIKFNYSEGNSRIRTQLIGGQDYQQNIGIPVIDLDYSRHIGLFANFKAPVTWNQLNGKTNGRSNYYGLVEFYYKAQRLRGFIISVDLKDGIGDFKVLLQSLSTVTNPNTN